MLSDQIRKGGFERRHCVYGHAEIEGLQAAPLGVAVGESLTHLRSKLK